MYECETCYDTFYTRSDCNEHMDDDDHWPECPVCGRTFKTVRACEQHKDATGHRPSYPCESESCDRVFDSEHACEQHMAAKGHWKNYCQECDRHFQNENSYRMHRNSRLHRGTTVACPFCKAHYTTASGLSHHLETGSCDRAPNLNRQTILQIIRERDPSGLITKKQIGWHEETSVTYSATDRAWDGDWWRCYICERGFNSKPALNQHLNSPVHQQPVYHCPKGSCGKEFRALAGLFGHLESETCGFMRFEKVQRQVGNVLNGSRLIGFG